MSKFHFATGIRNTQQKEKDREFVEARLDACLRCSMYPDTSITYQVWTFYFKIISENNSVI